MSIIGDPIMGGGTVTSVNGMTGDVDLTFEAVSISNVTTVNCSGTVSLGSLTMLESKDKKSVYIGGRPVITGYARTGPNPGITFETSLLPGTGTGTRYIGIRAEGGTLYPEMIYCVISSGGRVTLRTTETYSNAGHSTTQVYLIPSSVMPL